MVVFMVGCENSVNPIKSDNPTNSISQTNNEAISLAKQSNPNDIGFKAAKGPIGKATGSVMHGLNLGDGTHWDTDGQYFKWVFNAHESGKGKLTLLAIGAEVIEPGVFAPDGYIHRHYEFDVKYVKVLQYEAWFAGLCTYDYMPNPDRTSRVDNWFVVKVVNGGTPGTNGDRVGWKWADIDETLAENWVNGMTSVNTYPVDYSGNLQIHYYGN